ncbi:tubby-related protein 2 isoform X1 [Nannospalax galili]|uniref:tubby-related protein 2 isoform X1 n=2 Tax=Nannospalax galili TaxID=1026970 RepID=UPI00111BE5BC|nr:tubby-related protein 2 isoform X1 [Nannospalax galili]
MVQANPDASLRHWQPRRGKERFQSDSGWGLRNPFLQENVPQAHLPSRAHSALVTMSYVGNGSGERAPLLTPRGAAYSQGENGPAVRHLGWLSDNLDSDVEEANMEDIPVVPRPYTAHLATRRRSWLASPGPVISEEEKNESRNVVVEHEEPSPDPAPVMNPDMGHGDLASCKVEEDTAMKNIETKPASDVVDEDLEKKKEASESAETNAPLAAKVEVSKVPQGSGDTSNHKMWNMTCMLPHTPGPWLGEDLEAYVLLPAPQEHMVQCRIICNKQGMAKGMFPSYYLYLEAENGVAVRSCPLGHFLLAGRKRKKSKTSNYLISLDPKDLSRNGNNFVGKVRSNVLGTKFTIFDNGVNLERNYCIPDNARIREELGVVCYETNILGFRGPRKMTVILPGMDSRKQRMRVQPQNGDDSILSCFKKGARHGLVLLQNKAPSWSNESGAYVLNFHGRVTRASVKNFQIMHPDEHHLVLQFGRVASNVFTMDFRYPFCPLQAFAICLSSFDRKLACE